VRGEFAGGDPGGIRTELVVSADMAARVAAVVVVVMGAGDYPVWVMQADRDRLPTDRPGRWTLDFAVAGCPPLHGAFQVAIRVDDVDGAVIGVVRSPDTFWVRSGQDVGLLAVPYRVDTTADPGAVPVRARTRAGRGGG
jgi:hypothetical protein